MNTFIALPFLLRAVQFNYVGKCVYWKLDRWYIENKILIIQIVNCISESSMILNLWTKRKLVVLKSWSYLAFSNLQKSAIVQFSSHLVCRRGVSFLLK